MMLTLRTVLDTLGRYCTWWAPLVVSRINLRLLKLDQKRTQRELAEAVYSSFEGDEFDYWALDTYRQYLAAEVAATEARVSELTHLLKGNIT